MNAKSAESFIAAFGASLALIYASVNVASAFLLSASVIAAVIMFELIFLWVKRFWLKSLRRALALTIISTMISAVWILSVPVGFEDFTPYVPIGILSALFLIQPLIRGTLSFPQRGRTWFLFFVLSMFIGFSAEHIHHNFVPGIFWMTGAAVILFHLVNHKSHAV